MNYEGVETTRAATISVILLLIKAPFYNPRRVFSFDSMSHRQDVLMRTFSILSNEMDILAGQSRVRKASKTRGYDKGRV